MKKIILTLGLFFGLFLYGQENVAPLGTLSYDVPDGTYIKDMDNVFQPYVGTWKGSWDGKTFVLRIEKNLKQLNTFPDGSYYYEDELLGKFSISDAATGAIIETNEGVPYGEGAEIYSVGRPKDSRFSFIFSDGNRCSNSGKILLRGNPASGQLNYFYSFKDSWNSENCQYVYQHDIPIPIPTVRMILTKVE